MPLSHNRTTGWGRDGLPLVGGYLGEGKHPPPPPLSDRQGGSECLCSERKLRESDLITYVRGKERGGSGNRGIQDEEITTSLADEKETPDHK